RPAQPQSRGDVRPRTRVEGGHAGQRRRLQGTAEGSDPRRQPGAVLHGHRADDGAWRGSDGDELVVPLGKAALRREGSDVTLVSYAKTVGVCEAAANKL